MPRLAHALPRYRLHRASGQAVVTLGGRDHYLGPYASPRSYELRDQLIAQWLADGRRSATQAAAPPPTVVVNDLAAAYWKFAEAYYVKQGRPTGEQGLIKVALRRLCEPLGALPAESLTPQALREVQVRMIDEDLARTYINKLIERIRRMYKWGVAEGLVPVTTYQALLCLPGLKKGRTAARETAPVRPVAEEIVEATLPHLPVVVADLVRFQRLTGCRPEDAWAVRPGEIDRRETVWWYVPASHKTEHHDGHDRRIPVGPRAQAVLAPYLERPPECFCFSPREAEQRRRELLRAGRRTAVPPSQRNRRRPSPRRSPGESYDTRSYNRAIARACKRAGLPKWAPNQLRHAAATETRRKYGLEAAQALLGQRRIEVTQIYAQRRDDLAETVAAESG